jgi:hypothetical protein
MDARYSFRGHHCLPTERTLLQKLLQKNEMEKSNYRKTTIIQATIVKYIR